jgi:hypothetical protein
MTVKREYLPLHNSKNAVVDSEKGAFNTLNNPSLTNASVVIIGAGISGMCVAIDLLVNQKVKDFVILEKSGGFGGTWYSCSTRFTASLTSTGVTTSTRGAAVMSSVCCTPTPLPRIPDGHGGIHLSRRSW